MRSNQETEEWKNVIESSLIEDLYCCQHYLWGEIVILCEKRVVCDLLVALISPSWDFLSLHSIWSIALGEANFSFRFMFGAIY